MLSQDDQRRLADIERRLEHDDPAFARRMRTRRRTAVWIWVGVVTLASTGGVAGGFWLGWQLAAPLAAGLTLLAGTIIGWCQRRRRHRHRDTYDNR